MLRNCLITASEALGTGMDEQAEWITDKLLIDARAGGCQTTTRIAQAIETAQGLIFGLRSGQFIQSGIPLIKSIKAIARSKDRIEIFAISTDNNLWQCSQ